MQWLKRNLDLAALGLLPGVLVFAVLWGIAHAQTQGPQTQGPPPTVPLMCGPSGCDAVGVALMTASSISAPCATGMSFIQGTQLHFRFTCGTTATTAITVTWPVPHATIPQCVIVGEGLTPTVTGYSGNVLSWSFASAASSSWDIICLGL